MLDFIVKDKKSTLVYWFWSPGLDSGDMIETGVDETSWLIEVIASLGRQLFFSLLYLLDIILPSNNRKIYIIKKKFRNPCFVRLIWK